MPKTELQIVGVGLEDLVAGMERAVAVGDKLQAQATSLGATQQKSIEGVINAQQKYNLELVNTGRIVATSVEAKQRQAVLISTQQMVESVKALTKETGRQSFGQDEIIKKAQQLQAEYAQLNTKVKELGNGLAGIAEKAQAASDKAASSGNRVAEAAAKAGEAASVSGKSIADTSNAAATGQQALAEKLTDSNGVLTLQAELVTELEFEVAKLAEEQKTGNRDNADGLKKTNTQLELARKKLAEMKDLRLPVLTPDEAKLVAPVVSLRQQLRQAEAEAAAARRTFGEISPQFAAAAEKAAQLRAELNNTRESIEALNPEKKLEAIGQLTNSLIGGATAIRGAMLLTGNETDKVQREMIKLLTIGQTIQGFNTFFSGFSSSIKNISLFLRAATTEQVRYSTVQKEAAVVTGVNTEAQVVQAGATSKLTATTKGLNSALSGGGLLSAAAVLVGIAVAMVALGSDTEETSKKFEGLISNIDRLQKNFSTGLNVEIALAGLRSQLTLLKSSRTAADERNAVERQYATDVEAANIQLALNDIKVKAITASVKSLGEEARAALSQLTNSKGRDTTLFDDLDDDQQKLVKGIRDGTDEVTNSNTELNGKLKTLGLQRLIDQQDITNKILEDARAAAAERLRIEEDFRKAIETLQGKVSDTRIAERLVILREQANDAAKQGQLAKERDFLDEITGIQEDQALNAVELQREEMLRKLALIELEKTLSVEKIKALGEAELKAKLDNLIEQGKVELAPEQLEQFEILRSIISARAERERTANAIAESNKRIKVEDEELQRKLDFVRQEEQLIVARIDNTKDNSAELSAILREAGVTDLRGHATVEQAKLAVSIKFAQQQIELLKASGDKADAIKVEQLEKFITDTKATLAGTGKFSLAKLLGITEEELSALQPLIQQAGQFIVSELQAQLAAQQLANSNYISSLEERIAATKEAIDRENAERKEGRANDLEDEEDQLETLFKLKEDAQKEQEKLAQRQQRIQSILQLANLGTAIAGLLSNEALKGGVLGLAIAGAAIPVLFSLFARAKAQAAANVQQFSEGTRRVQLKGAPKGKDTVPAMLNENEGVMRADKNLRHDKLLSGIHYDDPRLLHRGILETASYYGIMRDLEDYFRRKEMARHGSLLSVDGLQQAVRRMEREGPASMKPAINFRLPEQMRSTEQRIEERRRQETSNTELLMEMRRLRETNEQLLIHEKTRLELIYPPGDATEVIEKRGDNIKRVKRTEA